MYRYALEGFIDLYGFDPRNYLDEDELSDLARRIIDYYVGEDEVEGAGRHLVEYAAAAQYNAYLGIVYLATKRVEMSLQDIIDELYRLGHREDEKFEVGSSHLYPRLQQSLLRGLSRRRVMIRRLGI